MNGTIFALATAPGRAALAVLRLSGPDTGRALEALGAGGLTPRRASLRRLRDPGGAVLDEALCLWFPGPHSFTGEDSGELHLHGGRAVIEAVTSALLAAGLRPAEPGEFTRRAFQNGRLDLTQAEAVADLVDAETSAQRAQALAQLDGALAARHEGWRDGLLRSLALLEAAIDFPDEDLPEDLAERVRPELDALVGELDKALSDSDRGERVREGYRIALIGAPNAGKSTLFNRLVGRDAAIVTPIAGTTRDIIEARQVIDGYAVVVADMAGLRASDDPIEMEGVRRARDWAAGAALRLWVLDPAGADDEGADLVQPDDLAVLNKADVGAGTAPPGLEALPVSGLTGEGVEGLRAWLGERIARDLSGADFPAVTRARHRRRLTEAHDHLVRARAALDHGAELAAEDVRLAIGALEQIAGRIGVEDVLGEVFASFCIGK